MTKALQFQMPVGALVGGLRHLGNGEFITDIAAKDIAFPPISSLFELRVAAGTPSGASFQLPMRVVDDPLTGEVEKHVLLADATDDFGATIFGEHPQSEVVRAILQAHRADTAVQAKPAAAAHASDCAKHNAPAAPAGPCDCGASDAAAIQ